MIAKNAAIIYIQIDSVSIFSKCVPYAKLVGNSALSEGLVRIAKQNRSKGNKHGQCHRAGYELHKDLWRRYLNRHRFHGHPLSLPHSRATARPTAGVGPLQTHPGIRKVPAYSPSTGSYPLPGQRLFYSAGDPTEREAQGVFARQTLAHGWKQAQASKCRKDCRAVGRWRRDAPAPVPLSEVGCPYGSDGDEPFVGEYDGPLFRAGRLQREGLPGTPQGEFPARDRGSRRVRGGISRRSSLFHNCNSRVRVAANCLAMLHAG